MRGFGFIVVRGILNSSQFLCMLLGRTGPRIESLNVCYTSIPYLNVPDSTSNLLREPST